MEYADFVEKCVKEYKETENEFAYQLISPFSETVVEKKLSKKELEEILLKGMKESNLLAKIDKAIEEMDSIDLNEYADNTYQLVNKCIEILKRNIGENKEIE